MINLAGKADCDKNIRSELTRCGIECVEGDPTRCEVPYSITGRLDIKGVGVFTFKRAWYYWMVSGLTPYNIALKLYEDNPVGKVDIRVAGHCGCPHPKEWAKAYHEGKQIMIASEYANTLELAKSSPIYKDFLEGENFKKKFFVIDNDDLTPYKAFVESYHIDSELGLYIFAETLKKHAS